ncbi:MAG: type III pantothenate kinase [Armatimonadetes bacterium]|nr:type III pantothenate kinase [Armatimonadota bacterium]
MLWAIDVGNTHTVVGLFDGGWREHWRLDTTHYATEDELAEVLSGLCRMSGHEFSASGVIVGSVVPAMNEPLKALAEKWLKAPVRFLETGAQVGLKVDYTPPHAVGADRIANALAALDKTKPPLVVVDFGTATTFDAVDSEGTYVGGAIMPGVEVSSESLSARTALLQSVAPEAPGRAIGKTVKESLQSGLVLGYAGAVDALARRISDELGGNATVLATGGHGRLFVDLCDELSEYDPRLTLDGLRIAWNRMSER